ncbi:MBL fold metallo-hydrolase [Novosphingobium aquiterrae]|uniref:MBL fold metallo-hydrolase n=1 Tax=Novosphingobium aquiterrae TaxID=624388 RepID=A0ABV6PIS0_9SPHN
MTRRLNWTIAIVLLLFAVPYYWLLLDNRPGDAQAKPVSIAQLRQLADSLPGPHPASVEMELIGWRRLPGNLLAAGSGLKRRLIGIMAFRLPVPGGRAIVIDSGITRQDADAMGLEARLAERQDKVDQAMNQAGLILITHEHPDHIGGLIAWAGRDSFTKAALNGPQKIEVGNQLHVPVAGAEKTVTGQPYAIAPGVVVIPAPSHTPGSQMYFVRLASGREYLFTGDIATMDVSWRELRARSQLAGSVIAPEDRREVYAWLKTIRALAAADPGLVVVPGHDTGAILAVDRPTGIRNGFNLSQIKAPTH